MRKSQPKNLNSALITRARRLLDAENAVANPIHDWNTREVLLAAIAVNLGRIADSLEVKE
jgi:hypothetical protein